MSDDAILLKLEEDYTCPITQVHWLQIVMCTHAVCPKENVVLACSQPYSPCPRHTVHECTYPQGSVIGTCHNCAHARSLLGKMHMQDYFEDPVTAADDYTYERYAITDWLSKHNTSPMTNLPLAHLELVANGSIKVQMQALLQQLTPAKQVEVANYLS